jgi:isopenicillin N synthase-like dioxygenase
MPGDFSRVPIVDIEPLLEANGDRKTVADQIAHACRESGFFYMVGHQVDERLQSTLEDLSRVFFAQALEIKLGIRMEKGGPAWRGYFPIGGELTSGKPDKKEGLYFGAELDSDHPLVKSGTPMHGPNLFPDDIPLLRDTVLEYMNVMTALGHALMRGIALSLGLKESYFDERYTSEPLILFRIFNYPANMTGVYDHTWGVGEHTDYGLLTILKQDRTGGLQVKSKSGWVDADPIPNAFVCNIGTCSIE